jgi:prevent-host-death family protein
MRVDRTLTDFLQHSGDVLPEVERGEVRLRRRGADDLVLVSGRHWDRLSDMIRILAEDAHLRAASPSAPERFAVGWLGLLGPDDRATCIEELRRATLAAFESGRLADLENAVDGWRATALATWDDEQNRNRAGYSEDAVVPLARP